MCNCPHLLRKFIVSARKPKLNKVRLTEILASPFIGLRLESNLGPSYLPLTELMDPQTGLVRRMLSGTVTCSMTPGSPCLNLPYLQAICSAATRGQAREIGMVVAVARHMAP